MIALVIFNLMNKSDIEHFFILHFDVTTAQTILKIHNMLMKDSTLKVCMITNTGFL
jgi:hypothetical protein